MYGPLGENICIEKLVEDTTRFLGTVRAVQLMRMEQMNGKARYLYLISME